MAEQYIKTARDARACIGQRVYWDDHSARYVFLRSGVLTAAEGKSVEIDGDWKLRPNLVALRNFEHGGAFKEKANG